MLDSRGGRMSRMHIKIRCGRVDDAPFLSQVLLASSRAHLSRGVWDLIIGGDDAVCLEYLRRLVIVEPRSLYHYETFRVAELEGTRAAALGGFLLEADRWARVSEALSRVQQELAWTEQDLAASRQRTAPIWSCFLADIGVDWGIENVAAMPEFRGMGVIGSLLLETLGEARRRGCKLAQVSTYIGNEAAIAVYERAGFRFSDEKRCESLEAALGTPGFIRLVAQL